MEQQPEEDELFRSVAEIVDGVEQSPGYQQEADFEEFVTFIAQCFQLPRRQAFMTAQQVRVQYRLNAKRQGLTPSEYAERLTGRGGMTIVGFCVGAVLQADSDRHRDPVTGDEIGPEFYI